MCPLSLPKKRRQCFLKRSTGWTMSSRDGVFSGNYQGTTNWDNKDLAGGDLSCGWRRCGRAFSIYRVNKKINSIDNLCFRLKNAHLIHFFSSPKKLKEKIISKFFVQFRNLYDIGGIQKHIYKWQIYLLFWLWRKNNSSDVTLFAKFGIIIIIIIIIMGSNAGLWSAVSTSDSEVTKM